MPPRAFALVLETTCGKSGLGGLIEVNVGIVSCFVVPELSLSEGNDQDSYFIKPIAFCDQMLSKEAAQQLCSYATCEVASKS